jgi:hypothetical protein
MDSVPAAPAAQAAPGSSSKKGSLNKKVNKKGVDGMHLLNLQFAYRPPQEEQSFHHHHGGSSSSSSSSSSRFKRANKHPAVSSFKQSM